MVPEVSAKKAHERWKADQDKVILLDVREPRELSLAQIAGAKHIPMNDIPGRLAELDKSQEIIVHCHKGGRSYRVAAFMLQQGFTNVSSMLGGIEAWSQDVDPTVPRY